MGYGEPPLYARPVAMNLAKAYEKTKKWNKAIDTYHNLLKRFPKSAYVLHALTTVYTQKSDTQKAKAFESKLNEAPLYADKGMYGIKM